MSTSKGKNLLGPSEKRLISQKSDMRKYNVLVCVVCDFLCRSRRLKTSVKIRRGSWTSDTIIGDRVK